MNKIYTIRDLPRYYFGREYTIFSFDVLNGTVPFALRIGTSVHDIVTICDLDKLNGYFEGDVFYKDDKSYGLFVEFLKSITVRQDYDIFPTYHDIKYVEERFFVKLSINNRISFPRSQVENC